MSVDKNCHECGEDMEGAVFEAMFSQRSLEQVTDVVCPGCGTVYDAYVEVEVDNLDPTGEKVEVSDG